MFVICGEALFDVFIQDGVPDNSHTVPFAARAGGSPFNVAVGLARLGNESALLTGVSTDFLGDRLLAVLEEENVATHFIKRKTAPTTLGFVQRDADGSARYAFYGEGAADRSLSGADVSFDPANVACLHIGSYSIVTPPTADALQELAAREAGRRMIALDPNVRPTVEPDLALWRKRVSRLIQWTDIIKASDEDLSLLYPDTDHEAVLSAWLAQGVKVAVVTRGQQGALLMSEQGSVQVAAPEVEVVDTVGAGDTFQTVLLDQLVKLKQQYSQDWFRQLNVEQLERIGKQAVAAAAITCSRQGADLPTRTELNAFLAGH